MAINGQTQPQKFSLYRYREGKSDPEHGKWFKKTRSRRAKQAQHAAPIANVGLVAISLRSSLYAEDPIRYDSYHLRKCLLAKWECHNYQKH